MIARMTEHGDAHGRRSDDRVSGLSAAREMLGFRLQDPSRDIRGWSVMSADNRQSGTVTGLIVDIHTRRIRYIAVALDPALERRARSRDPGTVLVPVGLVRRSGEEYTVVLDFITSDMLIRAPRLAARPIMRADEDATLAVYGLRSGDMRDPYSAPHFDDTRLFRE